MYKNLLSIVALSTLSLSAFAQDEATQTSRAQVSAEKNNFSEYVMYGLSAGIEYSTIDGDGSIRVKIPGYGTVTSTISTDKAAPALGVNVSYGQVRRYGFGFTAGATLLKTTEHNKKNKSLSDGGEFTQFRPEMNATYAVGMGLYGGLGAHLSHITGDNVQNSFAPIGIGLQVQVGYIPVKNLNVDLGYYISNHKFSNNAKDSVSAQGRELQDDSYINLKQLRARVSYLF